LIAWDRRLKGYCACACEGRISDEIRRTCECHSDEGHPHIDYDGREIRGCPFDIPPDELAQLQQVVRTLWWAEQGSLPEVGGLNDQAATYVDAAEFLARMRQEMIGGSD
jgi:hypothetical protein